MIIFITIILTLLIHYFIIYLIYFTAKRQKNRDDDVFLFKIKSLLKDFQLNDEDKKKISQVLEIARNTKGEIATGVYLSLELLIKDCEERYNSLFFNHKK